MLYIYTNILHPIKLFLLKVILHIFHNQDILQRLHSFSYCALKNQLNCMMILNPHNLHGNKLSFSLFKLVLSNTNMVYILNIYEYDWMYSHSIHFPILFVVIVIFSMYSYI